MNYCRSITNRTLKFNNDPHFIFLFYIKFSIFAIFYKDNGKTWLFVLFLGVITFHISCYSEIKEKKDDYWGEYD